MKVGTLTFHSSYNFGSNLQAYALQKFINKLGLKYNDKIEYSIINLRKEEQNKINNYKLNDNFLKKMFKTIFFGNKLKKRQVNFESFIDNYLDVTKEYKNINEIINDNIKYDCCITGSDQIWNLNTYDFDWSYFLDGINCTRKISYAVSSGPVKREITKENSEKIKKLLKEYDYISVREEGTKEFVKQFTDKEIYINMDPTILLSKEEWNEIIESKKIIEEPYILYYSLRPNKKRTKMLRELSKKMNMKVVVANPSYKYDIIGGFIKKYESGPLEFLNLLKNANLVISSSFHGTIFSVIFNVPFYALNGQNDYRINTLLKTIKLEDRTISENDNIDEIIKNAFNINFDIANNNLEVEKDKSEKYLKKALDIGVNDEKYM